MHLVSRIPQRVRIAAAGRRGRTATASSSSRKARSIWTESSYKYPPEEIVLNLERTGFRLLKQWIDRDDGFALTLAEAA